MKNSKQTNKKKLLDALVNNRGLVHPSCREAGLSYNTYYNYYRNDPDFKKIVDEINNINLDFVESKLYEKIEEGNERLIVFYLQYKGRKRGYTQSNNTLNIEGDGKIKIQFGGDFNIDDPTDDNNPNEGEDNKDLLLD
jgi:hypothetical protein